MEWVETTAKTLDGARDAALDQLGVGSDEAEFEVIEEPKPGLFGRTRGQARIRARVKPAQVRPKQERRRKSKGDRGRNGTSSGGNGGRADQNDTGTSAEKSSSSRSDRGGRGAGRDGSAAEQADTATSTEEVSSASARRDGQSASAGRNGRNNGSRDGGRRRTNNSQEKKMSNEDRPASPVSPQEVGDAAVAFMNDLASAFGANATAELTIDDTELDVNVTGDDLGLLVGPGGRTLNAIQDLARVSAQRRLGDHETRLRIDVAGYRERRSAALAKFAAEVAQQVRESGSARSLEPMTSADRKVIHDALNDEEGVHSTSSGEDPYRRVVVQPG